MMNNSTSSLFYEERFTSPNNTSFLIGLAFLVLCFVWRKILIDEMILIMTGLSIVAAVLCYRGRNGAILVRREGIFLEGAVPIPPLELQNITQLRIVERKQGAFYEQGASTSFTMKALTLPFSIPTYLLIKQGVLIERTDPKLPAVFLPSTKPEQLRKALEEAKRF